MINLEETTPTSKDFLLSLGTAVGHEGISEYFQCDGLHLYKRVMRKDDTGPRDSPNVKCFPERRMSRGLDPVAQDEKGYPATSSPNAATI